MTTYSEISRKLAGAKIAKPLTGERGLIASVVAQAYLDTFNSNPRLQKDALEYFKSDTYQQHLSWLNLSPDMLPENLS